MPHIVAVGTAFPEHYYAQEELAGALLHFGSQPSNFNRDKVLKFFSSVSVGGRHLALPLERYAELDGLEERNQAWLENALKLGARAVDSVLRSASLAAKDVSLFMSSTVTGIAVPSLEARLMNRMGFDPTCRRVPSFGLGCVAGAAGIARVSDYLRGRPRDAALLLCVELCSLTFQREDVSVTNIIASGLFGDGAACVLLVGDEHPLAASAGPAVSDTRSVLFRDTERTMGWDVVDSGFRIVLSSGVPEIARTALARSIHEFLREHGTCAAEVQRWVAHPGGPAVIEAMEQGLELPHGTLDESRKCLAEIGNLSSASVLVILDRALRGHRPEPGSTGLLVAMGPGFCAELVFLQW